MLGFFWQFSQDLLMFPFRTVDKFLHVMLTMGKKIVDGKLENET